MTPRRQFVGTLVLGLAFLIVFRWLEPTNYQIGLLMRCMILMIVTIGLNILIGHAGLVSLGQAALYGVGSYVAAWLAAKAAVPFLPAMGAGILATALFGAALAYPTVRVRGVYLAVITIAFGLVFENILVEWLSVTGGTQGLIGIPRGRAFGVSLTRPIYFWVVAGCLVVAFIVQYTIIHSRYGRAMRATAQSENAARALGINVTNIRILAFVISAMLAGLAGGLYTFLNLFVNYETFTFLHSVGFLLMVILGGTGTLLGPVVGTSALTYVVEVLQNVREWQVFAYGLLLALMMFVMPRGVVGSLEGAVRRLRARRGARESRAWPNSGAPLGELLGARPADARPAGGGPVLQIRDLTLRFGGLTAVNAVSLQVEPATVHALIGPNGAGKSSLLNVISGFYVPTSGEIVFDGMSVAGLPSHVLARRGIARTFQNTELFGQMTALENVLVGFHQHYRSSLVETLFRLPRCLREERRSLAQATQLLDFVGLSDYADEEARNLPFGHQRRLEIARAIALCPKLLLLDEPAAGLTHGEIEDLTATIRLLTDHGVTVILVEHHVEMVMTISDRVTVLDYGEVIASGDASEVQDDPRVIEAYFGTGGIDVRRPAATSVSG
jgi:ABC-type branched-subunit amino acid transport system ATPase component/ABC-type branched-subunit amino acid transport system permease subunit